MGGYWELVRRNDLHVFSIVDRDNPQSRSTLSLKVTSKGRLEASENRSYKNVDPSPDIIVNANLFVEHCNSIISKEINNEIKSLVLKEHERWSNDMGNAANYM